MRRSPFKQRHFKTKLKHRLKLNAKYDPRRRPRVTFTETISAPIVQFFDNWLKHITGFGNTLHAPTTPA